MADRDTLAILAQEFGEALRPLAAALTSAGGTRDLLEELGWLFNPIPNEITALNGPVNAVVSLVEGGNVDTSDISKLLGLVLDAYTAIASLAAPSSLPADFRAQFPRQLADYLLVQHLLTSRPKWGFLLLTVGIIRIEEIDPQGTRPAYVQRVFAFEDLGSLLSDPLTSFKNAYEWGQSSFAGDELGVNLANLLTAWGHDVQAQELDSQTVSQLQTGALVPADVSAESPKLVLIENSVDATVFGVGIGYFVLPETATDKPGFAFLPYATTELDEPIDIADNLTLDLKADVDLTAGVGVFVRPDKDLQFVGGLDAGAPAPVTGQLKASLQLGQPDDPILIVGEPDASRLEFGGISTGIGARLRSDQKLEAFTELALQAGRLVVKPGQGEGDSFLTHLLPGNGLDLKLDLLVGFSTTRGLYFGGSGAFEIDIPVHTKIGPIDIQSASIAVRPQTGAIPIDVAASFSADLSVLDVSLENVGFTANLTFPDDGKGNLGRVNFALGFKPPTGAGISINAGPVSGGGFLSFQDSKYSGVLALQVYSVAVKAFGIIETKLPNGQPGFSFMIIISAEFTPIQLGLGFTLVGVGGIIGINRDLDEAALRDAVQRGSLANVLFPKDPVRDAPSILHDVEALFPPTEGHYAFGPLARIDWGTPAIVDARLGIVLVFPGPRIALLGTVDAVLPPGAKNPDQRLVEIHLDIDGVLDFPKKHFALDAHLHDSQVRGYPISGDMAMRLDWGQNPNFIISLGGFHPHYTPPAGFPKLRRLAIDLGIRGNPSAVLSGYLALTSNTAQIGAALDVTASAGGASLKGGLAFDALFVFSPFSFLATLEGGVHVDFHGAGFGMHFHGEISGPAPWHLKGDVCVSILWWDACVGFSVTLGGENKPMLPAIDVWDGSTPDASSHQDVPGLASAVAAPGSWSGVLPPNGYQAVAIREVDASAASRVDPLGVATFQQKVLPLNLAISKFAGRDRAKNDAVTVIVNRVVVDGDDLKARGRVNPVADFFAPGQYQTLPDAQALSSPSFQKMQAGFSISSADIKTGAELTQDITFQTIVVGAPAPANDFAVTSDATLLAMVGRSAVAIGGLRTGNIDRFVDFGTPVTLTLADEVYAIASKATLTRFAGDTDPDGAYALKADKLAAQPADVRATLQIVPIHELAS